MRKHFSDQKHTFETKEEEEEEEEEAITHLNNKIYLRKICTKLRSCIDKKEKLQKNKTCGKYKLKILYCLLQKSIIIIRHNPTLWIFKIEEEEEKSGKNKMKFIKLKVWN